VRSGKIWKGTADIEPAAVASKVCEATEGDLDNIVLKALRKERSGATSQ
jgi:hypothetical protein